MGGKRTAKNKNTHKNSPTPAYQPKLTEDEVESFTLEATMGHGLLDGRFEKLKQ